MKSKSEPVLMPERQLQEVEDLARADAGELGRVRALKDDF